MFIRPRSRSEFAFHNQRFVTGVNGRWQKAPDWLAFLDEFKIAVSNGRIEVKGLEAAPPPPAPSDAISAGIPDPAPVSLGEEEESPEGKKRQAAQKRKRIANDNQLRR